MPLKSHGMEAMLLGMEAMLLGMEAMLLGMEAREPLRHRAC
jgi:hypothetical protein